MATAETANLELKHSEIAAKLAIEGAVSAIGGAVKGELGLTPRVVGSQEKVDLGIGDDGETLCFEVGRENVFLHTNGARTTIWYSGDCSDGVGALDAAIQRYYPDAMPAKDDAHATEPNLRLRTYDVKLPNNHLAIVDAVYPVSKVTEQRFMIRVTAMARQN
jgi:hypothetical protein